MPGENRQDQGKLHTPKRNYQMLLRVAVQIKERFGMRISPRTLSQWLAEYWELTTYARLRPALLPQFQPHHLIRSTPLHHQQAYHYRTNQGNLVSLLSNPE